MPSRPTCVSPSLGFTCGALCLLRRRLGRSTAAGGARPQEHDGRAASSPGSASAIVLGTILDGIPESFVLGASLRSGRSPCPTARRRRRVRLEHPRGALRASAGLLQSRLGIDPRVRDVDRRRRRLRRWQPSSATRLLDAMRSAGGAFVLAFAAGALLVMLADTLMPEAFELGGREAGLVTALGFAARLRAVLVSPKQRPREARRPAVALLRDLLPAVDDDVDACALHPTARLGIAVESECMPRTEREHVGALALELLVRNLDDGDPAVGEELEEPHRRETRIDEARSRSSGEMNDMRCMTSPRPFQCGRSNERIATPGKASASAESAAEFVR